MNGGECNDGTCICPTGFSGTYCETEEPCELITCLNDGVCVDGICNCQTGYVGSNCETEFRANLIGTYSGISSNCLACTSSFLMVVSANQSGILKINLDNLCSWDFVANVQPDGVTFLIPDTTIGVYTFSGTGLLNGNSLTVNFNTSTSFGNCQVNFTKQ